MTGGLPQMAWNRYVINTKLSVDAVRQARRLDQKILGQLRPWNSCDAAFTFQGLPLSLLLQFMHN